MDAGFPMSDHADWKGLLQAIKATEAEIVHVTHGQTEIFSKYLNEIGIKSDVVETLYGDDDDEVAEKEVVTDNKNEEQSDLNWSLIFFEKSDA